MMAEYVLRAERKDNSDGKTMFGLFLLVRTSLLNQLNIRQGASLEIWILVTLTVLVLDISMDS